MIGLAAIGSSSWPDWYYTQQPLPAWDYSRARELPAEWFCDHGHFVAGRAVLSVRDARLVDVRGRGDWEQFELHLGWDPERCDLALLEVELEGWEGQELAYSRRLELGETALLERAAADQTILSLPTFGRRLRHSVRLHDRDGARYWTRPHASRLVEQIGFTMSSVDRRRTQ